MLSPSPVGTYEKLLETTPNGAFLPILWVRALRDKKGLEMYNVDFAAIKAKGGKGTQYLETFIITPTGEKKLLKLRGKDLLTGMTKPRQSKENEDKNNPTKEAQTNVQPHRQQTQDALDQVDTLYSIAADFKQLVKLGNENPEKYPLLKKYGLRINNYVQTHISVDHKQKAGQALDKPIYRLISTFDKVGNQAFTNTKFYDRSDMVIDITSKKKKPKQIINIDVDSCGKYICPGTLISPDIDWSTITYSAAGTSFKPSILIVSFLTGNSSSDNPFEEDATADDISSLANGVDKLKINNSIKTEGNTADAASDNDIDSHFASL